LSAQALLTLVDPASLLALILGGVMIIVASLIIGIAPLPPTESEEHKREAGHALRILKNASVPLTGVFISGLLFSIFVTFYAAYGADRGLAADLVPVIGVVVMAGATFVQPLLGRVLERKNPILWLIGLALISALASLGLVFTDGAEIWLYVFVALWGASALTTYPLYGGLAYAALTDESVFDVARAILVSYGVAEIIAPPLMGMAIDAYGVNWLFGVAALAGLFLAGLLMIGLYRSRLGPILDR
jgi:predicted MFS family arabinose efflux permease